jgi:hypothetical protein
MTHDSTWLGRTRAARRLRFTAPFGLLLACLLLAAFASTASAAPYDMRGEWSIELTASAQPPLPGKDLITKMEPNGEFSGKALFGGVLEASVAGTATVSGTETSLTIVAPGTPIGTITFVATAATIDVAKNAFAGPGIYYNSKNEPYETGGVIAKRLRTLQEVKEQEEREQKEREEKLARASIRGEWALTLKVGSQTTHALALINNEANSKNEFASTSALFESVVQGSFSGTLEGGKATVTVTTEAYGEIPPSKFTSNAMTIASAGGSLSMSGTGTFTVVTPGGPLQSPGELTATRTHSYGEIKEREAKEAEEAKQAEEAKAAKEAQEAKEAKEAKEAEEARAKQAREARERQEKEAAAKSLPVPLPIVTVAPLASVEPAVKTVTVGGSGSLALGLSNPNAWTVQGSVTLFAGVPGHASKSSGKGRKAPVVSFGSASFTISAHGTQSVKIKLSHAARADLTRHKTLRITVTISTNTKGMQGVSKTYTITLHAPSSRHGKG